jgi:hypothetical protein
MAVDGTSRGLLLHPNVRRLVIVRSRPFMSDPRLLAKKMTEKDRKEEERKQERETNLV